MRAQQFVVDVLGERDGLAEDRVAALAIDPDQRAREVEQRLRLLVALPALVGDARDRLEVLRRAAHVAHRAADQPELLEQRHAEQRALRVGHALGDGERMAQVADRLAVRLALDVALRRRAQIVHGAHVVARTLEVRPPARHAISSASAPRARLLGMRRCAGADARVARRQPLVEDVLVERVDEAVARRDACRRAILSTPAVRRNWPRRASPLAALLDLRRVRVERRRDRGRGELDPGDARRLEQPLVVRREALDAAARSSAAGCRGLGRRLDRRVARQQPSAVARGDRPARRPDSRRR